MPPNGTSDDNNRDHDSTPSGRRRPPRLDLTDGRNFIGYPSSANPSRGYGSPQAGMMPSSVRAGPSWYDYPYRNSPFSPSSYRNESTPGTRRNQSSPTEDRDPERRRDMLEEYHESYTPSVDHGPGAGFNASRRRAYRTPATEASNDQQSRIARRPGEPMPPALESMLQHLESEQDHSTRSETHNRSHSRDSTTVNTGEEGPTINNGTNEGRASPILYVDDTDDIDSLDNHLRLVALYPALQNPSFRRHRDGDESGDDWEPYDPATFGQPGAAGESPRGTMRTGRREAFRGRHGRWPNLQIDTSAGRTMGSPYHSAGTPSGIGPDISRHAHAGITGPTNAGTTAPGPRELSRRAQRFIDDRTKTITTSDPEAPNTECPVCFDTVDEHEGRCVQIKNVPGCQHMIGLACLKVMLTHGHQDNKVTCPYCRSVWLPELGYWQDSRFSPTTLLAAADIRYPGSEENERGFVGSAFGAALGSPVFTHSPYQGRVREQDRERMQDSIRQGMENAARVRGANWPRYNTRGGFPGRRSNPE